MQLQTAVIEHVCF